MADDADLAGAEWQRRAKTLFRSLVERLVGPLAAVGSFIDGCTAPGGGAPIPLIDPASEAEGLRVNDAKIGRAHV